jgi:D-arginine dehydrogenase
LLAGARPLGLVPKKRTAFTFSAPPDSRVEDWPMVVDAEEQFYFKPDAGRVLASPADEIPSPPCDARPQDLEIALAVERIETATHLKITHIQRSWAGLRTFASDKVPVAGLDPSAEDFFWLAGQGGYGIMTSPALSQLAAGLIAHGTVPPPMAALGLSADQLSPLRFENENSHGSGGNAL